MKKGFTLIELLAVIIILGVIMSIAIPNIVATIDRNKKDTFISDAKRLISAAEYKIRSDTSIDYPPEGSIVILRLQILEESSNLDLSPFGTPYSRERSFVAVVNQKVDGKKERAFYVHLVACEDVNCNNLTDDSISKVRGIFLANLDHLSSNGRFDLVEKGSDVNYGKPDSDAMKTALYNRFVSFDVDVNAVKVY